MHQLHVASQTVQNALATKQIGAPLAVRIVAHQSADHGTLERLAAVGLETAAGWLRSQPDRLMVSGSVERGQLSTLARFAGGQTALVSAGSCGVGRPLLEVVVIGSSGILSWEADDSPTSGDEPGRREEKLSEQAEWLLRHIRESLEHGRGVLLDDKISDGARSNPASAPRRASPSSRRSSACPRKQSPPYGVLLVSGDHTHQPGYAESLASDKRCKLIGLTDEADVSPRRGKRNGQLAQRLGIPLLGDLPAALARKDVHIVSVCAEPARRGRIVVQAAEAGKHLYLDKPLAGSLSDCDAIVAAAEKAGVVHHMFSQVHAANAERVRQVVQSGELGPLAAIHFDLCFAKGHGGRAKLGKPRRETPVPKRFELADSKRELSNVGVYPLVMLLWLLGQNIRSVFATTGNYFFEEHQKNDMEDFGQILLSLDGDVTASIAVGRAGWRSHPGGGLNRTYLIGTKQTAVIDLHRPRVAVWADATPWTAPDRNPEDPMGMWSTPQDPRYSARPRQSWLTPAGPAVADDATYFLDCIEQGRQSDVSATVAAESTEILMAAYQSAATGQTVDLPLPRDP